MRKLYASGLSYEDKAAYSRAVRVGNIIEVSGTTAFDTKERIVGQNDAYRQSIFIFSKIENALQELGGGIKDVVRSRIFVTDIDFSEDVMKAHSETFRDIKPAATLVAVNKFVHPDLLVEIEVTAILDQND